MNYLLLFLSFLLLLSSMLAQQRIQYDDLPQSIKKYFPVIYRVDDTTNIVWFKNDTVFLAKFYSNNVPVEVRMKENGFWIRTYWELDCEYLPTQIIKHCFKKYPNHKIIKCMVSNNPFNEYQYHVLIKHRKNKTSELMIDFHQNKSVK